MTIPLNDDTKATFLNILRELLKSLPNSGADDVAAIMYLHDRMTECEQGRTLMAYVEAAHADPVAVRITAPLAAAVIANCDPSLKIPLMDDCSCKATIHHTVISAETDLAQVLESQRIVDRQSDA